MSPARVVALAVLAMPLSALAQPSYSSPPLARGELRVLPDDVRTCVERNEVLLDRRASIERERQAIDLEAETLARTGADLDDEWRTLDRSNAALVASYNARSERHNRRVEAQNRRVANFNSRTALLNADSDEAAYRCSAPYLPPDRDATWRERNRLR
jgi:hypothetical protein